MPLSAVERGHGVVAGRSHAALQLRDWHIQLAALCENNCAFDEVLQLAHVTGPRGVRQHFHCSLRDRSDFLPHSSGQLRHKIVNKQRNVFSSLTKRRDLNRKHVQSIKQVFAKLAFANHCGKVLVCRCNDSRVDMDGFGAPQTLELLLLNGAQQLGLQFQADVTDFVEKERTMIRKLESAFLLYQGSSESPFLVPKKFAFQQSRGNGGTVHSHERAISPGAEIMNGACD